MRSDSYNPTDATDAANTDTFGVNAQGTVTDRLDALSNETVVRETSAAMLFEHEETLGKTHRSSPASVDSENQADVYSDESNNESVALLAMTPRSTSADLPELIGERRRRSHTLHTKILTRPGAIAIALVTLFSLTAVAWLQRDRTRTAPAESVGEMSLPTQVDIALSQNDLDEVSVAMKALIDEGRFSEAVAAIQSASQAQQQDAVIAFLSGRSHWGLATHDSKHSLEEAMRAWETALESESDWMEIVMALGFAQQALGRSQLALESWQRAVSLAEKQATTKGAYFSDKTFGEYALNAYAGIAITSLSLSEIETNAARKQQLLEQSVSAYQQVINQTPAEFDMKTLTANWLWLEAAIADWETTITTLEQTIQIK